MCSYWDAGTLLLPLHQPTAVEGRPQSSPRKKEGKGDGKLPLQSGKETQILRFHPGVRKGRGFCARTLGSVLSQGQLPLLPQVSATFIDRASGEHGFLCGNNEVPNLTSQNWPDVSTQTREGKAILE